MSKLLPTLFENNRKWAESLTTRDPDFFPRLAEQQTPEYLWIGCSDSRVPANQVVGLAPGEVFVHRNIANMVVHSDFNCLSVIEYAVVILRVKHIIVCGHDGCGGICAAMQNHHFGLNHNWLRHVRDVRQTHDPMLSKIEDDEERLDRLCELNVIEQVHNVSCTTVVQESWEHGHPLAVHGWIYAIQNGLIRDLDVTMAEQSDIDEIYRLAIMRDA